jgi:redox-sensitive bicupin YhaK (pirin superfamily)
MITLRPAGERGRTRTDWLDSRHTFSFADYHDPAHMGFRTLRVINDDRVAGGGGFPTHAHRDMEILTWVLDGALEHRDSLGNGSVISPGEAQRMSAGTGIRHSEFNHSPSAPVHLLQIWIVPARTGLAPGYEERAFTDEELRGAFRLIASSDGRGDTVTIHQDVDVHVARLDAGGRAALPLRAGRHAWLHVARGGVRLGRHALGDGDGAALGDEPAVDVTAERPAEVLVFDLA